MFKILTALILSIGVLSASTYVVVDIAQGISKKEYKELGKLTYPDKKDKRNIYKHKEEIFLYSFNATNTLSSDFTYLQRDKDEDAWKESKKSFMSFFSKVNAYGVKKKNKASPNIIFLVDTSGSMKKNGVMDDVKSTIKYLINAKSEKAKVAIVSFDGKKNMKESTRAKILCNFSKSNTKLNSVVSSMKPSRYDTFLGSGLLRVERLLSQVDIKKTLVLLFTDGKAVDDKEKALKIIKRFKSSGIKLKVVAVGGADVDMLKSFSTTGYVFNATSNDLKSMTYGMSVGSDELFLRLNSFLENSPKITKNDRLIIYSSMMNVDTQSDFFIVPNIASKNFYKEMQKINEDRSINVKLHGAKVYVRLIGKMDATRENNLKIFYKRFFKEAGGELKFFANSSLSKSKIK
ncbi:VWA domain-containing protein [Sulfurimonas sp. SAG-AH-194-C20]|nr:vWA domain-containing protein [Sulfurimonas sp. SAG-AH-194-C20]MDF1878139.1 VWA domain-containing protein [Sulfurimonas sp. SAG-AH-194-C20]